MTRYVISSGIGFFQINEDKYYYKAPIKVIQRGDYVIVTDTSNGHVIAKGDYTNFLNGNNGNVEFGSAELLSNFFDTVFTLREETPATITGWGNYADTVYTSGSPFVLNQVDLQVNLPNNAGIVIDNQKPTDISEFYDGTKILGKNGDAYSITIEFKVKPTGNATNARISTAIDIGGAVGEIYLRDFSLSKGINVEHHYLSSFTYYTLDTFEANGGTIRVQAFNEDLEVYDIRYVFARLHKSIL